MNQSTSSIHNKGEKMAMNFFKNNSVGQSILFSEGLRKMSVTATGEYENFLIQYANTLDKLIVNLAASANEYHDSEINTSDTSDENSLYDGGSKKRRRRRRRTKQRKPSLKKSKRKKTKRKKTKRKKTKRRRN
tara:strand:- start:1012 stop:1410 length:399 start_codon:yes stop_codon:yes gene_type:complete